MFSIFSKQSGLRACGVVGKLSKNSQSVRFLATVQTTSTARVSPFARPKGTPVYRDRATFTIKDGPIFHGKSFGAKANISGEAVFTTSLVGYPESMTDVRYLRDGPSPGYTGSRNSSILT
jgi:carbamoyl-phosphate synthase small subunit